MKKFGALFIFAFVAFSFPSLSFAAVTHRVKKHETLTLIAQKYHVTVKQLKEANNLVGSSLSVGDRLVIPAQKRAGSSQGEEDTYTVRRGDRLAGIARKNGITVAQLKRLNGISRESDLKAGMVLTVRAPQTQEQKRQFLTLKNPGLLKEREYEQTLAELVEAPQAAAELPVDVELNAAKFQELKKNAYSFLGTRYRFGGESRRGIDCSSFVQQVFRELSVALPRTAREQYLVGDEVPPENLQKGDLIFFRTYARFPSHVGIYLGGNKMIHASSASKKVVISDIRTPYYQSRYIGAKRIAKINPEFTRIEDLVTIADAEQDGDMTDVEELTLLGENLSP